MTRRTTRLRTLGVSPAARGPGFARSRATNNVAQLRRASTATNSRGGTVSALRARIPDAVDHRPHTFGSAGRSRLRRAVFVGGRAPHTPTFRHQGVRWRGGRRRAAASPGAAAGGPADAPARSRGVSGTAAPPAVIVRHDTPRMPFAPMHYQPTARTLAAPC